ncbi:hypothetical protein [Ferroacidibacillus organovorans]|uniref:Uncharacterized protein n=1 Tax=Ferroacidibacillus organovorans TaxID=1765683 RepID=A0A101XTT8_9BACL|nr:hypothetical protein [Ferroacidibacillus organovorans]KUO97442.1 hypothetical protein ATW55_06150 [Ferroacidibacillus organovorans]KUO97464.1 hypothetical protein ATW55_06275 [Ferroacidibacillus organovorans]
MKKLIGQIIVLLGLSGCGTHTQSQNAIPSGTVLGWNNHLYKVVRSVTQRDVGKELGKVSFHGRISGLFTTFELIGSNPSKSIVFESPTMQYEQANIEVKNPQ